MEEWFDKGLHVQGYHVTLGDILYIVVLFAIIRLVIFGIRLVVKKASDKRGMDEGIRFTLIKLISYFLYTMGIVMALDQIGVNINALLVGSAALLVGLGLGIQQLFNDVISGFVILFEGVVRVGDVIEFDGMIARVVRIDIRTSKVVNRKGVYLIVPNSKITTNSVINWTHHDLHSRFDIKVGVAYGSDTAKVKRLLIEVAKEHPLVVSDRQPEVVFAEFADSSLNMELRFWATRPWQMDQIKSDIRFRIDEVFREHDIKIPFPQREMYVWDQSK